MDSLGGAHEVPTSGGPRPDVERDLRARLATAIQERDVARENARQAWAEVKRLQGLLGY